jgi:hypothetical protein
MDRIARPLASVRVLAFPHGDARRSPCRDVAKLFPRGIYVYTMVAVDIPAWDGVGENTQNPMFTFVKQYSAGTQRIKWVAQLNRYDLCTLHAYTTQVFSVVQGILRASRYNTGRSTARYDTGSVPVECSNQPYYWRIVFKCFSPRYAARPSTARGWNVFRRCPAAGSIPGDACWAIPYQEWVLGRPLSRKLGP